jgi:hypothetical protein
MFKPFFLVTGTRHNSSSTAKAPYYLIGNQRKKGRINLNATSQTKHQVESRLLLDVVVRQSAAVLQLLAGENQTLLIGGNALLVLDLLLDVVDGVRSFHIEGDGLASQGLHENLHAAAQTKHQVESRLLLDVVVRQSAAVLQLLAGENQPLLIGGNALLVLDLLLDVVDGVRSLHIEGDCLASQGLHENLHFLVCC